eukprot:scaffold13470_cov116-Isochrysis_galbana.AAC.2
MDGVHPVLARAAARRGWAALGCAAAPSGSEPMDCFAPWRPQEGASDGISATDSDGSSAADDGAVLS